MAKNGWCTKLLWYSVVYMSLHWTVTAACECNERPQEELNKHQDSIFGNKKELHSESLLPTVTKEHTERRRDGDWAFAEASSFPNIQAGSIKDELYSQWYVVEKNGKANMKGIGSVEKIFKQARKSSVPHTYKELIQTDQVLSFINHIRHKRHVFSVIDSRERVSNTDNLPYSSVVFIKGRGCTGYFIGPRHILTAGHCVFNVTSNSWFKDLNFHREKNCDPDKGESYKWVRAIVPAGYKDYKHPAYDYAMIISHKKSPAVMNFGWVDKPSGLSSIHIVGYPTDKAGQCMWESSCEIEDQWSSLLGHKCDTSGGNSGSPVFKLSRKRATAYCIHRGHIGVVSETGLGSQQDHYNVCSLITKQRFLMFSEWIAQY